MTLIRRIACYLAFILPSLGLFLDRLRFKQFNSDEFQHTYLAWASLNFDQLPYRDLWDNHGPMFTIVNSLFIKLANLQVGVETIITERYMNLFLLLLGFVVLMEVFHLVTGKFYYTVLGPWLFSTTLFATYAIQVRPDNLQCLLLYLALFLLLKAIKDGQSKLAFWSGFSLVLMLMTNLKSIYVFVAILSCLILLIFIKQDCDYKLIFWSLIKGLSFAGLCFVSLFVATGTLEGYINYNILYNKIKVFYKEYGGLGTAKAYYFRRVRHLALFTVMIPALIDWSIQVFQKKKLNAAKLIIIAVVIAGIFGRLYYPRIWMQYDLLFIPMACFITSWFLISKIEANIVPKIPSRQAGFLLIAVIYLLFLFGSWYGFVTKPHPQTEYLAKVDHTIKYIQKHLKPGEHIERFTRPLCVGAGFSPQADVLIQKYKISMNVIEEVFGRELYGQDYINLLETKKVRFIIGTKWMLNFFKTQEVKDYILEHYHYRDCLWTRKNIYPWRDLNND